VAHIITDFLDEIVKTYPDKTAFQEPEQKISFSQLRKQSQAIAQGLIRAGIFRKPIAIYIDRSISCILAMLGVAYSGSFYTVLDTEMPLSRVERILETLKPEAFLTIRENGEQIAPVAGKTPVFFLEDLIDQEVDEALVAETGRKLLPTDILYVLFTSGSTGVPKGVVTPHEAVIRYIEAVTKDYDITAEDSSVLQAPLYFVMAIVEIFSPLYVGCTTHIVPKMYYAFPAYIMKYIEEHKITMLYWVPSAFSLIVRMKAFGLADISSVKKVIFGGEVMQIPPLKAWMEELPDATFINAYGPTESTDGTTYYKVDREFADNDRLPIGIPFSNIGVLVLDENDQAVSEPGKQGELCIYGPSVTYGYYGRQDLTDAVFVQNPLNTNYPEKIYRTGDLVEFNQYGEMEFAGRKDFQIKHMGHRIELGEIEANAASVPGVEENACFYDSAKERIVMYYSGTIDRKALKQNLKELVPEYMVPGKIIQKDVLPHNLHGKIDRRELKEELKGL
jgi:D-alanine--poly(phosphoribitol) ligase subunit 1